MATTSSTRTVARLLLAPFWIGIVGLLVVSASRFVAWDDLYSLNLLDSHLVWIFLPAYVVASAAWCFRRYALAIAATLAVAFHVVSLAATIGSPEPITDAARRAPHVRLLSANLRFDNTEKPRLARELLAADADVVLLQEVSTQWLPVLHDTGFDAAYPYSVNYPNGAGGEAIYSRHELHDVRRAMREFWPTFSAQIDVGGKRLALVDVHAIGPTQGIDRHRNTVDSILDVVRSLPEPRVVAGDFNATPYNETMHRFAQLGLDSAHERRGQGLDATWPNGTHLLMPIQLDHVLVDDDIVVLSIKQLRGHGSDHKPVLTDLAIL